MKILFQSKDAKENLELLLQAKKMYLILSLILALLVYLEKGLVFSLVILGIVLAFYAFQITCGKNCLDEHDPEVLDHAINLGDKINFVGKILVSILWFSLYGIIQGCVLTVITFFGTKIVHGK